MKRLKLYVGAAVGLSLTLATACGGGGAGTSGSKGVTIAVDPSAIPIFVAQEQGFFKGVKVKTKEVGQADPQSLLLAHKVDVAWMSPVETAGYVSQGSPFIYYSTAGAVNMWNGVVVRAEDSDKYQSIADLQGHKLGMPGFGSGTWKSFTAFAKLAGIDKPKEAFDLRTADPGALLALVEKGEVDGALLFSSQSVAARTNPKFQTIFSFTKAMQQRYGVPLVITGQTATRDWYKSHKSQVSKINTGLDKAVGWMQSHPEEFKPGGKYADRAKADGWFTTKDTTRGIIKLLSTGKYETTSDIYTDKWRSAVAKVVRAGKGTLVTSVPPTDSYLAPAK